jgi:hypothetical protein
MRYVSLLTVLFLLSPAAHATILVPAEFREIVNGSQVIVHGRVSDVRSYLVDARKRIDTVVTLDVESYLKGGPADTVTFRVPGGTVGRYRSTMVGAPEFSVGEEVVLFLRADGPAVPQVFGLSQGVYRVRTDAETGRRVVVPPPLLARSETPETVVRGASSRRPLPLDAFGTQVRAAMTADGAK